MALLFYFSRLTHFCKWLFSVIQYGAATRRPPGRMKMGRAAAIFIIEVGTAARD